MCYTVKNVSRGKEMNRQELIKHISEIYGTEAEYPWASAPQYAVFRHANNRKWFAVIMDIPKSKLGLCSDDIIDIVNLKCDPILTGSVRIEKGIFPAYHMNKSHWISVSLDGSVEDETVRWLLSLSFDMTSLKIRKRKDNDNVQY